MQKLLLLLLAWIVLVKSYVFLGQFQPGYERKCYVQPILLNPPIPNLHVSALEPGEIRGLTYDKNKNYCKEIRCTLFENHRGNGYRLENYGCNLVKKPKNCEKYREENNRLPYPACCYYSKCNRRKIRLAHVNDNEVDRF